MPIPVHHAPAAASGLVASAMARPGCARTAYVAASTRCRRGWLRAEAGPVARPSSVLADKRSGSRMGRSVRSRLRAVLGDIGRQQGHAWLYQDAPD